MNCAELASVDPLTSNPPLLLIFSGNAYPVINGSWESLSVTGIRPNVYPALMVTVESMVYIEEGISVKVKEFPALKAEIWPVSIPTVMVTSWLNGLGAAITNPTAVSMSVSSEEPELSYWKGP